MPYEFAKELMEAEFPYGARASTLEYGEIVIANLPELIEACGEGQFGLARIPRQSCLTRKWRRFSLNVAWTALKSSVRRRRPSKASALPTCLTSSWLTSHAENREHWKRFADRTEQAESDLKKIFCGINAKRREEVLANLPEATGVMKDLGELFDPKEWIGITVDFTTPIIMSLAKDETTVALAMIGADQHDILADDGTAEAVERGIAKMART